MPQRLMKGRMRAALYDLDGTLVRTNLVHSYLFTAWTEPSLLRMVTKTLGGVARIPAFYAVDQLDRRAFNEMLFRLYKRCRRVDRRESVVLQIDILHRCPFVHEPRGETE